LAKRKNLANKALLLPGRCSAGASQQQVTLDVRFKLTRKEAPMIVKLKEMTTEEKLKAMEALWDDICQSAPDCSLLPDRGR